MAGSEFRRSGADINAQEDSKLSGSIVSPGPYEAVIMGHVQGNRMGQLLVYIPELGGTIENESGWIKVNYASPFFGQTYLSDSQITPDRAETAGQSYGMWMVPPDIGNKVLVLFVMGQRNRGYWFACTYDTHAHHMVPGMARSVGGKETTVVPEVLADKNVIGSTSILPVAEAYPNNKQYTTDGIETAPRKGHVWQTSIYALQGLDRDPIRGAISSSSLRESPSNVYGISTPGRKISIDDQFPGNPLLVASRKGGHQFVMDDGSAGPTKKGGDNQNPEGTDQLIRLRTAGGHQILMNDTEHVLYIASDIGAQWMEFSSDGSINVYGAAGINMRAGGPLNLHSDSAILMQAPFIKMNASFTKGKNTIGECAISINSTGSLNMSSLTTASLATNGSLSLSAVVSASLKSDAICSVSGIALTKINGGVLLLNSGSPGVAVPVLNQKVNTMQDTVFSSGNWVSAADGVSSVCTRVPAHEPWVGPDGKSRPGAVNATGGSILEQVVAFAVGAAVGAAAGQLYGVFSDFTSGI